MSVVRQVMPWSKHTFSAADTNLEEVAAAARSCHPARPICAAAEVGRVVIWSTVALAEHVAARASLPRAPRPAHDQLRAWRCDRCAHYCNTQRRFLFLNLAHTPT